MWWWVSEQADKGLGSKQIINAASAHLSTSTSGKGLTVPLRRKGTDRN